MAKILVVEDEPALRESVVEELNDEGHVTVEAGNGLEGLEILAVERPDLILSDITMPEMNGYQFFRTVKERHPEHADTPFIFLSALSERDDELKGLRLGVDDYLKKPIDFDLLLARIDVGLRRRASLVEHAPPPAPSPDSSTKSPGASTANISEIAAGSDGRVLTGKFETISLEAIKTKVGDRWSEVSKQILTCAEAAISDHLGPGDAYNITSSQDFIVCFADLNDEQMDAKAKQIGDAIWERIFQETGDEDLSRVDAQAFEIPLTLDNPADAEAAFSQIDNLIEKEKVAATEANRRKLSQIYEYEDLFALPTLTTKGTPSKIKMLSFEQRYVDQVSRLFGTREYEGAFLLDLQKALFNRLKENQNLGKTFSDVAMLLPIHFVMVENKEIRNQLIEICRDLESSINTKLILEVIEAPNRIKSRKVALKALPVGRKLQFLEIRRSAQTEGVEPSELRELGIAFVSMHYEDAIRHDQQDLMNYIKLLEQGGTKFFIKDIPEGGLIDAQSYKAHLYALRRK
ncbi:MAG: response regulator transcription factor [Pseudomonadota bacterium]